MEISEVLGTTLEPLQAFATSLAVGLLIGLERERNPAAKAGLRTFALTALLGSLTALLAQTSGALWLLPSALLVVGVMTMAAYWHDHDETTDPGTTTVVAIVLCYVLGAVIWYGFAHFAVPVAIITTSLLYFKAELRGLSEKVTRIDLVSILQFGVLSLIVLPVLPDRNFGPYESLNPYQIWLMVVLISGVSLTGYLALRIGGHRYGAAMIGLFGGLVSSTATTLSFARRTKTLEALAPLAAVVILLASAIVLLRVAILIAAVSPGLLFSAWPGLAVGFGLGIAAAGIGWYRLGAVNPLALPEVKNPTELRTSLMFGVVYAIVLMLSAWFAHSGGSGGVYGLALVSGLTDVDAITLSSVRLHAIGKLTDLQTVTAITIALIANLSIKFVLTLVVAGRTLAKEVAPGLIAIGVGLALGTGSMHLR